MTGLDPARHVIVEIASLITDDDLNVIAEGPDLVIHQPAELAEAGEATLAFLRSHIEAPRTVPLCGNSIGMDRRFLSAYLPDIENFLHYRSIDVSSVKELAKRWYPRRLAARPHKTGSHRALDDIRESVAELAFYRQMCFMPPESAESAVVDGTAASGVPPSP